MNVPADQLARRSPELRRVRPLDPSLPDAFSDSTRPIAPEAQPVSEPLSRGQHALWFLQQSGARGASYNLVCSIKLIGDIDVAALGRAVRRLWNRHPLLRATFALEAGEVRQQPGACSDFHVRLEDAQSWDAARRRRRWNELSDAPFDLQRGPLMRASILIMEPDEHVLHLAVHHIIADFWSLSLLMSELVAHYAQECGLEAPLPTGGDATYAQFVEHQRRMLAGDEGTRAAEFWRQHLQGTSGLLNLPTDRPYPATIPSDGAALNLTLDSEVAARLKVLAQSEGTTLYVVCLSAFYTLLHRYSGQDDLVVATPTLGRSESRWARVPGYFTNPVGLRLRIPSGATFRGIVREVRDLVRDGLTHGDFPFSNVVEQLDPPRAAGRPPLAQVMFAWERAQRVDGARLKRFNDGESGLGVEYLGIELEVDIEQRGAPFEITLQVHEDRGAVRCRWQYSSALFDEATVRRMAEHYRGLLASIAADADRLPNDLPLVTAEDRAHLVELGRGLPRDYPTDLCLDEWFDRQAAATPDAPALRFRGAVLTYAELDRRTEALAVRLQASGLAADGVVGVYMNRSLEMVVALLGIVKAGGAYLPLNPEDPLARTAFQLDDAGVSIVLAQQEFAERLTADPAVASSRSIVALDDPRTTAPCLTARRRQSSRPDSLAYVIYTSGSTGRPKGVMIEHRAIVNRLQWMQEEYGLAADDRVLQKTPATFDVSVWEFFWPLVVGAELVVAEPGGHRDAAYLARLIDDCGITTLHFVPTMLRAFLDQPQLPRFDALRRVFASGEALTADLAARFHERCSAELHNLYGPTEAAVDVTYWHCRSEDRRAVVPIGRPIANMETLILDEQGRLQPIGIAGELCLAGIGLARGYLNRPELTAERFPPHPLRPGERMYRTGDVARWTAEGVIEYLGRSDDQIKLGGNRIELGEIEAVLSACEGVSQAAVDVRDDAGGGRRIVGYFVPAAGAAVDVARVRRTLAERLPPYMIPASLTSLDALPTTSSGKVDRRALPAPARRRGELEVPYVAPRSAAERELAELFAEVLQIDRIGIHDNFFDLGGASNQAVEIIRRANLLGYPLTPELVFRYPTIAGAAEACSLPQPPTGHTLVESLGVYLPPRVVTSDEVMSGCERPLTFPLRRLTGIKSRRVAGDTEFSWDLAVRAVEECFGRSKLAPADIDAVICCNISRYDGPNLAFTYEPSTASRLCARFGLRDVLAFDISNACAGMFTGMSLADGLLRSGLIGNALVVSGEYISYLTDAAQRTIENDFDSRLPCLTVGDAGAALILSASSDRRHGLHELELRTLSEHSELCVAKFTPDGPIMFTDMLGVSSVITQQGLEHWIRTTRRKGWSLHDVNHVIPHQVSQTTIVNGFSEMRKRSGAEVPEDVVISNVAERGNTATTSHWVAVWDHIRSGRIKAGDNVVFGVSGSGITVGTALYRFDDLPERVRAEPRPIAERPDRANVRRRRRRLDPRLRRAVVAGCGTALPAVDESATAIDLARRSAEQALRTAGIARSDVDLLIYGGVYRDEYLTEPAVATMIADRMRLHPPAALGEHPKFFAFDVLNGSVGFLQACYLAAQRIQAGGSAAALVATAEVECTRSRPIGLQPSGGAFVLRAAPEGAGSSGFGEFVFCSDPDRVDARTAITSKNAEHGFHLNIRQAPDLESVYCDLIARGLEELRERESLAWSEIDWVLPPYVGPEFSEALCRRVPELRGRAAPFGSFAGDLFTSATPFAWQALAAAGGLQQSGRTGIVIAVGAGVQAVCASYRT